MNASNHSSNGRVTLAAGALMVFLCFLWGANIISIKISNQGMPPMAGAALRSLIAAVLVGLYAKGTGRPFLFPKGQHRHALVIGGLFGVEFLMLYWGLMYTPASRSVIFFYSHPFWVALGAHFLIRGDRLGLFKSLGLILAFAGILVVFRDRSPNLPTNYRIGDLMMLVAAVCWGATTLYVKVIVNRIKLTPHQTLFAQLAWSFPLLLAGSLIFDRPGSLHLTFPVTMALAYQSIIVAFLSYLAWFWMIHRYAVSSLSSFTFLAPLFGVILGALVLGETVTPWIWIGIALVAGGIYLVNR